MADSTKVTRIKATDSARSTKSGIKRATTKVAKTTPKNGTTKKASKKQKVTKEPSNGFTRMLASIGGYFAGAWFELKQVRWPTRKATWGLTIAVILFSAFFVVLILLLDAFFKFIFELMIK